MAAGKRWLFRPVFAENGVDWRMEKWKEVPAEDVREGWTMTPEEFMDFWSPNKEWRAALNEND